MKMTEIQKTVVEEFDRETQNWFAMMQEVLEEVARKTVVEFDESYRTTEKMVSGIAIARALLEIEMEVEMTMESEGVSLFEASGIWVDNFLHDLASPTAAAVAEEGGLFGVPVRVSGFNVRNKFAQRFLVAKKAYEDGAA